MASQPTIAVIGAGVIGSAVARALARGGRRVILIDCAPPGEAGASHGKAGQASIEMRAGLGRGDLIRQHGHYEIWRKPLPNATHI